MAAVWCLDHNPAYKLSISDVISLKNGQNGWEFVLPDCGESRIVHQFQIQVKVLQLSGLENEIMIVSDSTGKAKITRGAKVPGDFSWVKAGCCCSIVGTLVDNGKLPHIDAVKMGIVENPVQIDMWLLEVEELKNLLSRKICPRLEGSF